MADAVNNLKTAVTDFLDQLPNWARYGLAGAAIVVSPAVVAFVHRRWKGPRKSPYKEDWKQGLVVIVVNRPVS